MSTEELYIKMNKYEEELKKDGYKNIIGIDEVGRGPLAGPLVVAGVILENKILGLNDSKKLSKKKIEQLNNEIISNAKAYVIVEKSAQEIDELGIKNAVILAMQEVVEKIDNQVDFALIDYEKPSLEIESLSLKKGDEVSNSIAAASIVAKYYRDEIMKKIHEKHPMYGFDTHVGYGTKKHIEKMNEYGIIKDIHRLSYKPVKKTLGEE